jgi:hypothetical protein
MTEAQKKRVKALEWWRQMSLEEQMDMAYKHYGSSKSFVTITTASHRIEAMYKLEQLINKGK